MPFNKDRNSRDDRPKRTTRGGDAKFSKDNKFGKRDDRPKSRNAGDGERKSRSTDGSREYGSSFDRSDRKFDRDERSSRPKREYGGKDDRGERRSGSGDSRDRRPSFDRPEKRFDRESRRFESSSDSRERRSSFDRTEKKFDREDRPYQKKTGFGGRDDRGDRKPRSNDNRERRDSFDKSERKFDREDRPYGKRKEFGGKDDRREKPYSSKNKFGSGRQPASREPKDDGLIRLNRYISNSGICSRRKADELITAGVITVNGEAVTELGTKVDPFTDDIRYNNERLKREKMVYVLLNKPKDFITTTDDPQERRTVMQLVSKATKERIYPVGRLDRNTTGLLLLTNDGNLAEKLAHPRNNVSKIYNVELDKNLTQGDFNKLEFGLELEDGFVKPDDISYVAGGSKNEIGVQIHSGKNRIVRRMFEHLGYEVVKLDRVVYANLTKKDLPRGRWRYVEERELFHLKQLIKK